MEPDGIVQAIHCEERQESPHKKRTDLVPLHGLVEINDIRPYHRRIRRQKSLGCQKGQRYSTCGRLAPLCNLFQCSSTNPGIFIQSNKFHSLAVRPLFNAKVSQGCHKGRKDKGNEKSFIDQTFCFSKSVKNQYSCYKNDEKDSPRGCEPYKGTY